MQLCEILQQLEGLNFPALTENQRADLDRLVSQEEREAAVFQLGPTKASGSDGLPMVFYQRFWGVVRPVFTAKIQAFIHSGTPTP
jgi:hypothetical protein